MTSVHHQSSFCIDSGHPALPGHFPQRPVVPGVVLLDRVAAAMSDWRDLRIASLLQVKFLSPLLPGQRAELQLHDNGKSIQFDIVHANRTIANGIVQALADDTIANETTDGARA